MFIANLYIYCKSFIHLTEN